MSKSDEGQSTIGSLRTVDAARGIVITVIAAVIGHFVLTPSSGPGLGGPAVSRYGLTMLLVAIVLQIVLLVGRPLIARYERAHGLDGQISPVAIHVFQLVADGLTVLLFALAVFGGITQSESNI
jgi:hypothetical protein